MSEQDSKPTDDSALTASEAGTGIIPEHDESGDVSKPASEADMIGDEGDAPPQSWPGKGFGSIPPPG